MALEQTAIVAAAAAGAGTANAIATPGQMLVVLLLGGTMGLLGQGVRAVVGLKSMTDDARLIGVNPADLFKAARLLTSLMIGVIVGLAEAIVYMASAGAPTLDWHVLLGFAATAYAGTDFLEGFISTYLSPTPSGAPAAVAMANMKAVAFKVAAVAPTTAQQLVINVLNEALPGTKITPTTKLADLGFDDNVSKDYLRAAINAKHWRGVELPFLALDAAATVADIIKIVSAAEKS